MPVLDNPKWELAAQEVAKGRTQVEAIETAGYSPHRSNASRLIANDSIKLRVSELQEQAAMTISITLDTRPSPTSTGGTALSDTRPSHTSTGTSLNDTRPSPTSTGGLALLVVSSHNRDPPITHNPPALPPPRAYAPTH
jgi:hypothetical protein